VTLVLQQQGRRQRPAARASVCGQLGPSPCWPAAAAAALVLLRHNPQQAGQLMQHKLQQASRLMQLL
jgi:hypothetical protein